VGPYCNVTVPYVRSGNENMAYWHNTGVNVYTVCKKISYHHPNLAIFGGGDHIKSCKYLSYVIFRFCKDFMEFGEGR
jgi:hypothetical protein